MDAKHFNRKGQGADVDDAGYRAAMDQLRQTRAHPVPTGLDELPELPELPDDDLDVVAEFRKAPPRPRR